MSAGLARYSAGLFCIYGYIAILIHEGSIKNELVIFGREIMSTTLIEPLAVSITRPIARQVGPGRWMASGATDAISVLTDGEHTKWLGAPESRNGQFVIEFGERGDYIISLSNQDELWRILSVAAANFEVCAFKREEGSDGSFWQHLDRERRVFDIITIMNRGD